ncbi:LacI family DNA-binding transcriptional regulator [Algibacter lectus]|uniref:LacI family DNA-binding transcriptional regulator n=1 Tax=Algibacter lectus TaxID=221126 RepID=UPI0026EE0E14|nr:LacI family DNA-binding transcriptional regulator [Algibacter lectus]MDO7135849.1 LacI family DNA-binding transcriptional regulator [Algibacter lectus]
MDYVTIKDVAKRLNLAVSTISRAFNDKYDIKKETKELILKTAAEMGYHPNPMAKKLTQKRSFNIGIVVPEFINGFFPEVIIGAQEILFEKGYQVLITQSNESYESEIKNVKTLVDNMVDGLIISLSSESKNTDYYQTLIDKGFPIVFFNRVNTKLKSSKILFNDYKWALFATEHLITQGYKNIVHLEGLESLTLSKERKRGFIDAHKKYKIELTSNHFIKSGFTIESGKATAEIMIKNNQIPNAIFASCDPPAIGAMMVFKENGYKIPTDIAFVGFTESKLAGLINPPLTSVMQPTHDIGVEAAKMLLDQIENPHAYLPQTIILNGTLNIRESSVKII